MMRLVLFLSLAAAFLGGSGVHAQSIDFGKYRANYDAIDARMGSVKKQLTTIRERDENYDSALAAGQMSTFGDQITLEVFRHLVPSPVHLSKYVQTLYMTEDPKNRPLSLISHSLCPADRRNLEIILRKKDKLIDNEVNLAIGFRNRMNGLRDNPDDAARGWTAFAGCLAYAESLGDADDNNSRNRALELMGSGYVKPPGVKFYYDKLHSNKESRWNIGLFQFVLWRSGNIAPCIDGWRELGLPGSAEIARLDEKGMGNFVASPSQSFNAFCGINKLIQSFFVQVYTDDPRRTHPANSLGNGTLKAPAERCVSIHDGRAYSHFSPQSRGYVYKDDEFARSGNRSNFHKVMQCTMAVLDQ